MRPKRRNHKINSLLAPTFIYEEIQLKAVEAILLKDMAYFERKVKRWFSKEFSTPLPEVDNLPWLYVLQHYYEAHLEQKDYNEVLEAAKEHYLPDFIAELEAEDEAFAESLVDEQAKTIEKAEKLKSKDNEAKSPQSLSKEDPKETETNKPQPEFKNLNFDEEDPDQD